MSLRGNYVVSSVRDKTGCLVGHCDPRAQLLRKQGGDAEVSSILLFCCLQLLSSLVIYRDRPRTAYTGTIERGSVYSLLRGQDVRAESETAREGLCAAGGGRWRELSLLAVSGEAAAVAAPRWLQRISLCCGCEYIICAAA